MEQSVLWDLGVVEKQCSRCAGFKLLDEFGSHRWCKTCYNEYMREYGKTPQFHDGHLRRSFGITLEVYEMLLKAQCGVCAICGKTCKTGKRLGVDHDHETGAIRGLLCLRCDTALGQVDDNIDTLKKMIAYLTRGRI